MSPDRQSSKIEELDSIRGLAALLVVLYHMPAWTPWLHAVPMIKNSSYMVDLFFVLSGYVMNLNYADRLKDGRDLARFQVLRLGRVYPVHLLFLIVAVGAAVATRAAEEVFGISNPNGSAFKDNTAGTFIQQLLLVHALGPDGSKQLFNLPSWSVSVEFYTYLVFGVICAIATVRNRLVVFSFLAVASVLMLSGSGELTERFSQLFQCFAGYFLGCVLAAVTARYPTICPKGSSIIAALLMAIFLAFNDGSAFNAAIFLFSALLVMTVASGPDDAMKRILRLPVLKFLGLISYSVYMSHAIVLWSCNQFIRVVMKRPEAFHDGISTPQLTSWGGVAWYLIAILCTIGVSALTFRYVEDPWRIRVRKFVRERMGDNTKSGLTPGQKST
jgi:peptidoglycan/LPS O-acetylase OafA/YrhL